MQNFEQTIISQYANSPTLVQLIDSFNGYLDPSANIDAFYDLVWNVATAEGYGLDIWGRIVGVNRVLPVANELVFGFEEATDVSASPFNVGVFYEGGEATSNFALSDTAFRILIYAKALANISDGSIPALNLILRRLFAGRGNCYVTDGLDMTMTYTFEFSLTSVEQALLSTANVLPKPVGVSVSIVGP